VNNYECAADAIKRFSTLTCEHFLRLFEALFHLVDDRRNPHERRLMHGDGPLLRHRPEHFIIINHSFAFSRHASVPLFTNPYNHTGTKTYPL